jgi:hypothetical protein
MSLQLSAAEPIARRVVAGDEVDDAVNLHPRNEVGALNAETPR